MDNRHEHYKVDYFLLAPEFKEGGVESGQRISYMIRSDSTVSLQEHQDAFEELKDQLLRENDEDYTSWRFTGSVYKNIEGISPHVTIIHFRLRDAG